MVNTYHPFRCFQIDPALEQKLDMSRKMGARAVTRMRAPNGAEIEVLRAPPIADAYFEQAQSRRELMALSWSMWRSFEETQRFQEFWDASRQVIAFDPNLGQALAHTEIRDAPWSDLRLPLNHFYLGWGTALEERYQIQNRVYCIDGAYIRRIDKPSAVFPNGSWSIAFTSRRISPSYEEMDQSPHQGIIITDPVDQFLLDASEAATIGLAIDRGIETFERYCATLDAGLPTGCETIARELNLPSAPEDGDPFTPSLDRFRRGRERITAALPLLFNCIFYLTHRPEDVAERFDIDPPNGEMVRLAKAPSPEMRRRKLHKLSERGYHQIRYVSNPQIAGHASSGDGSAEHGIRPHWRRGHWARQPCGPGMAQRKWLWRMPMMVNAESGGVTEGVVRSVRPPDVH